MAAKTPSPARARHGLLRRNLMNHPLTRESRPQVPTDVQERSLFRALFMAYPDALLLVDQSGDIAIANPSAATLLAYPIEELIGLSVDALVPDSIRPRHAAYREAYNEAPRARAMGTQMELVARRRDGSEVMVEIALSPLQNHGLPFVVAAIRDISAYPRVKQALQRARYSEHLAQAGRIAVDERDPQVLLDQVPIIATQALQVEVAMVFLLENDRSAFRVAGAVGAVPGEAVGARIPNRLDTSIGFVLSRGEPVIVPNYRDERRFMVPQSYIDAGLTSALAVPVSDRGRTIGAFTVRSRASQRFGDDEVRFLQSLATLLATTLQRAHSEEALNHAQRLESVGQLTGGIAHDFNNLLTVIQGNLQVLEELPALVDNAQGQQVVAAAMRASLRAAELTGKLLAFSRRQVLQPTAVDVPGLLASLADMLRRTLDQRIRIEVDVPDERLAVLADAGQLESALLNIAINARDAMPDGGALRFHAYSVLHLSADLRRGLEHPGTADEQFVAVAISDTGTGMPDEVRERAFEPFFTTKVAGRGTGLGLSTVYGFVKQSRGAVSIDSTRGAGTTITMYIPRPAQPVARGDHEPRSAGVIPAGTRTLLVEDNPEVRSIVRTFLDAMGCTVHAAASAEEALLALGPGARFDLLLTDVALGPGMRGTQLAAEAQRRLPHLAILLMSGYSSGLLDTDLSAAATWQLLRKPCTRDELMRAVASTLETRPQAR